MVTQRALTEVKSRRLIKGDQFFFQGDQLNFLVSRRLTEKGNKRQNKPLVGDALLRHFEF